MSMFRPLSSRILKFGKLDVRKSFSAFGSNNGYEPRNDRRTDVTDPNHARLTNAQIGLVGTGTAWTRKKKSDISGLPVVVVDERNLREDVLRFKKQFIRAVQPMIKHNSFMDFYTQEQHGNEWLSISTPRGKFHFYYQPAENCLMYVSYDSGYHGYRYDAEDNVWLSKKEDKHNMLGMITRDMIHHLGGCPDFNYADLTEANYVTKHGNAVIDEDKIEMQIAMLQLSE